MKKLNIETIKTIIITILITGIIKRIRLNKSKLKRRQSSRMSKLKCQNSSDGEAATVAQGNSRTKG